MIETKCHWDTDNGWMMPEHQAGCEIDDCQGCRPCALTHCAMRGRCAVHVDTAAGIITCPGCVGKVRTDMQVIEERMIELDEEIEVKGVASEALNLAGPASIEPPLVPSPYDVHHPLLVLGRWDMMIREDYEQPTMLTLTVSRARDYLDGQLSRIANDDGQDFELLASEVATCRSHLENVLGDSRAPERGAPCPTCRTLDEGPAPKLVKVWASRAADDKWKCPRHGSHWWTDLDYRTRVKDDYVRHADNLPTRELAVRLDIPESTIRRWASSAGDGPRLKASGKSADGRITYSVEAAETLRGATSAA